jgi:hypothetical protein
MENFITGKEKFTPTVPTESISQQGGGYGVPTQEESLGTIEASGTPYFSKTLEERALTPIEDEYSKRVKMPTLGALEALKDIRGKEFSPSDFVTRTVNKKGGHDFAVNKAKVEDEANKYAIHMVGNTNYGKNQNQTKVAMEKQAYLALQQAGLSDSEIAKEMPNVVRQLAYDDFMRKVQPAIDGELTRQKEEPLRKEGKNSEFNINIGAGGENKLWKFGIPAKTQIREGATREVDSKELVKGKEGKLIDYDYVSMQTKVPADNPPITVGNNSGMHFQGVYKNRNNGDISYFKFTKAADGSGEEILVPLNELKSSTFTDIKTNIGEDDFDKATATGKYKQNKAAPKKADLKGKKYAGIDANGNPIFK